MGIFDPIAVGPLGRFHVAGAIEDARVVDEIADLAVPLSSR
jgi:hypothetical protein